MEKASFGQGLMVVGRRGDSNDVIRTRFDSSHREGLEIGICYRQHLGQCFESFSE